MDIKGKLKEALTSKQINTLLKIYNYCYSNFLKVLDDYICRTLSYKLILILGCQRSGTTLLLMLLTAHQKIRGKDEDESGFSFPGTFAFVGALLRGKKVCYKLPTRTHCLDLIMRRFPQATVIWISRDPLSVVSSMKTLSMHLLRQGTNWLQIGGRGELMRHSVLFPEINNIDFKKIDPISLGAYIWKYKMKAREKFMNSKIKTFSISFEELVDNPKKVLLPILKNTGLNWDKAILNHQKIHKGKKYVGGTIGDRPLNKQRIFPPLSLTNDEIERIKKIVEE